MYDLIEAWKVRWETAGPARRLALRGKDGVGARDRMAGVADLRSPVLHGIWDHPAPGIRITTRRGTPAPPFARLLSNRHCRLLGWMGRMAGWRRRDGGPRS